MTQRWDPTVYRRFAAERAQPFTDLVAMIERWPRMRVVDLGCGTGELTATLVSALDPAEIVGIDSSPAMLAAAAPLAGDRLRFELGTIEAFEACNRFELVVSNAALHWVADHEHQLARLRAALTPSGQLAIQMPANFDHPAAVIAADLAREPPFERALGGRCRGGHVDALETYATHLHALGFARQRVLMRVYLHELPDVHAVYTWMLGSTLTWYRAQLSEATYERFAATYRERLLAALPDVAPFPFTFKRIFLWGSRSAAPHSGVEA